MEKALTEMSSRELFLVLTGERGVVPQVYLQNIIREYMADHDDDADLPTMVKVMAEKEKEKDGQ